MLEHLALGDVEVRAGESGPYLHGVILAEGRAATGGRAELFAPGSVMWPSEGIAIRAQHRGAELMRAMPSRVDNEIRIEAPATDAVAAEIRGGKKHMSVEFLAMEEQRTRGGVREIRKALVDGAALVSNPEYSHTRAEVRSAEALHRVALVDLL